MSEKNLNSPIKETITDALNRYRENVGKNEFIPTTKQFNQEEFEKTMSQETDPDLMMSYELIKLPSKGLFYKHGISEVQVEYMTSKDEDLLTTPSLIDSGKVLDLLLKRKIKTKGISIEELLPGDRNAILLFLRTSSYGPEYKVNVFDPRTNKQFPATVNLLELKYKEVEEKPDENGLYSIELPMRKKTVKVRILSAGEENEIFKQAEANKEEFKQEFSEYHTMKLKASIVSINNNRDRSYIDRFVNVMPAGDSLAIRRKLLDIIPDVDMSYEFTAPDGHKFTANLSIGLDFFFPSN